MKVSIWFAVAVNLAGLIVGCFAVCMAIVDAPEHYRDMCNRLIRERQDNYIDYAKTEE